jgi:hypothetical protein
MWDKRKEKLGMYKKFNGLWFGPYKIERSARINYFYLTSLDGERSLLLINGQLLKFYFAIGT